MSHREKIAVVSTSTKAPKISKAMDTRDQFKLNLAVPCARVCMYVCRPVKIQLNNFHIGINDMY